MGRDLTKESRARSSAAIRRPSEYSIVDLFAGSGAFTYGLRRAGLSGKALLVDQAKDCAATCQLNHPDDDVIEGDISTIDWSGITASVVVAGPPCQGFSSLGHRNEDDPRNYLYQAVLACVEQTQPQVLVIENVPRFLTSKQGTDLVISLRALGYGVRTGVIDCTTVGTPQRRQRALISGAIDGTPAPWPIAQYGPGLQPLKTVADAFAFLPRVPDGKNWHISISLSKEHLERVRAIPHGGSRVDLPADLLLDCWREARGHTDVMGRLRWSQPATTLRTEFFRPEKGRFLHPSEDRSISIREGARLQSFPDTYRFPEHLAFSTIARQIGNAIPVSLAESIGQAIRRSRGYPKRASSFGV
jgi:DNA (cytosine-5)-methyltransferase 1